MPTLHLVRHDIKAWDNGRKPPHREGYPDDPPLLNATPSSNLLSSIEALRGKNFTGVYCSPFVRTRQTGHLLLSALGLHSVMKLNSDLGEYLGNQRRRGCEISPETLRCYRQDLQGQLHLETIPQLDIRVRNFLRSLPKEGEFLVITHGIVIKRITGQEVPPGGYCEYRID